jgi:hypothetical protein
MNELKPSVRATYDSTTDGDQYHVTVRLDDQTITFQRPMPDPFVRQTVMVGWRDLLRALFRFKPLAVTVIVGGDIERINDVLELDDQTLIKGRIREAAFRRHINERLADV